MPVHSLISCMALNLYGLFASVFEFYLWLGKEKKKEASRPAASCTNWQVNHVSVGWMSACVCVCLWKIQDLSLEAACDRGSSVLLTPLPLLRQNHWWEDRGFAFSRWREIRGQESEPNYRIEFGPNKTLQHVCGNEELCFCVRLICQWPPPNSCWLGRVFSLLLIFAPPSMYYCSVKGSNVGKRWNPTSSLLSHGIMTSHNRMQGHEGREKKKSLVKT